MFQRFPLSFLSTLPAAATLPTLSLLAVATELAAQAVQVQLTALTPLVVQVTDGLAAATDSIVGPLPQVGNLSVALPTSNGAAGAVWTTSASDQMASVFVGHGVVNTPQLPAFVGRSGPFELLVEFAAQQPVTATLELARLLSLAPGAAAPTLAIDYGNDGIVDVANLSTLQPTSRTLSLAPGSPLQLRIVIGVTLGQHAFASDQLAIGLRPDNDLSVTTAVAPCGLTHLPSEPFLRPSFLDRGVDLLLGENPAEPAVVVVGVVAQPALLAVNGALPCVLLPSPDVVLLATGSCHIALPASVRPVSFFAQGVRITSQGLRTTAGFAVVAH